MGKARAFPTCPMLSHLPFCRMERIRAKQEKHRQGRANRGCLQGSPDPGQEPGECGQRLGAHIPCVHARWSHVHAV